MIPFIDVETAAKTDPNCDFKVVFEFTPDKTKKDPISGKLRLLLAQLTSTHPTAFIFNDKCNPITISNVPKNDENCKEMFSISDNLLKKKHCATSHPFYHPLINDGFSATPFNMDTILPANFSPQLPN
jgi:hypothetical protein